MFRIHRPYGRAVALSVAVALVSGCALPRTGPTKNEIFAGSVQKQGDAYIVTVDDRVAKLTSVTPALGFPTKLINAATLGSDTIQPGDTLSLRIWENVQDGLLASAGTGGAALQEIQVDGNGFIFVPYAGRIRAAGNSPEAIRRIITEKLEAQTPDPQVLVNRVAGDGATVSLIGNVGGQGVYPIERPTRTLTAMLAQAGGITLTPDITQVTLIRGHESGTVWLSDLYRDPALDISLRAGDRILVEQDNRSFTALGATGAQTKVPFDTPTLTAIEAMANVGGLSPNLADPTGIFVFRDETPEVANAVLARNDFVDEQRVVYVLDLTSPNGVFVARDFDIRDGDTIYVTEAPYTQFSKILSAIVQPLGAAASIETLVE
ncbi:polysaccharide biosynthesis/export family protein [Kangsaoukella pontilimi]|uniref:polysaccharide biosynthesis/export family protein n=1 Tax=Kangsaoukella pontilimi TaxID=2691042 RepID=UPI0029CA048C|nr:polysaccharide biosynthesis/export family protein [Kangsaoukella pontilimi]